MEVLLDAFLPNLLKDFLSRNESFGNHLLHESGFGLPEKKLPGIIPGKIFTEVIDYEVPPVNGRDFHNLIQCLLYIVFHTTILFIGLILFFRQEKPCSQEQLCSQCLVPVVSSGAMKILRVDQVHQQKLGKGIIGILNDMVHKGLGH